MVDSVIRKWEGFASATQLGRLGWEALTGPPAAGALAVLAAYIAYRGLDKTVKRQDDANTNALASIEQARLANEATVKRQDNANANSLAGIEQARLANEATAARQDAANAETRLANRETARKNDAEQWWKTLEWAYSEAKSVGDKASAPAAGVRLDNQTTKESKAIIAILRSLANREDLTEHQKTTVAEVLGIFADPEVQEDVDEALIDLGRTTARGKPVFSAGAQAHIYEQAVYNAIRMTGHRVSPNTMGDSPFDALAFSSSDRPVGVQVKYQNRRLDRRDIAALLAISLGDDESNRSPLVSLLVVSNSPLSLGAKEFISRQSLRAGYVTWHIGDPIEAIERELERLGNNSSFI
jgi:hypothetical protein